MTSSPLLTSVAEFVVMTRPIEKLGCARACSGVTSASSARDRPRNGPPLAVTTSRRTSSAVPPRRHWAIAECSLSTGTIWPGAASALTSGPPMMSDSLLASASVVPARSAASVGSRPMAPVMPLTTTSASRAASVVLASGPTSRLGVVCRHAGRVASARERRGEVVLRPARHGHDGDAERDGLLCDEVEVGAGGEPDDLEAVAVALDEVDGLRADRAGRAEQDDAAGARRGVSHPGILAQAAVPRVRRSLPSPGAGSSRLKA